MNLQETNEKNILNQSLKQCGTNPMTGWKRDGFCSYRPEDGGRHLVCAEMTSEFLEFSKSRGNDLKSKSGSFPGLKSGDNWCICAGRYSEAKEHGKAPPVNLEATHEQAKNWSLIRDLLNNVYDFN
jgi:uncharacterized protein (DUF2237 family)